MRDDDAIDILVRWSDAGGHWRVLARTPSSVTVSLRRCDGGEEADRLTSADPALLTWIGDRRGSED